MSSYHKYECRIASALETTQLSRLPLVMASLRGITQKSVAFFRDHKQSFLQHDIKHGVDPGRVYRSEDYQNLFNLVTHSDQRSAYDIVTKHIIAGVLVVALQAAGYFSSECKDETEEPASLDNSSTDEADVLIGKLLSPTFFSSSISRQ